MHCTRAGWFASARSRPAGAWPLTTTLTLHFMQVPFRLCALSLCCCFNMYSVCVDMSCCSCLVPDETLEVLNLHVPVHCRPLELEAHPEEREERELGGVEKVQELEEK